MRLRVLSDPHMEKRLLFPDRKRDADFDVLVVAGDVWESDVRRSIEFVASLADGRPAIFVAGNHEYWGCNFTEVDEHARDIAARNGVHYLESDIVVIDGVRFAGCTLWDDTRWPEGVPNLTKILTGDEPPPPAHWAQPFDEMVFVAGPGLLDRQAKNRDMLKRHEASAEFLRQSKVDVVVTHYPPRSKLVEDVGAELWVHGHVHTRMEKVVGVTRVVSNAIGYPYESLHRDDAGLDPMMTVELALSHPLHP